MFLLILYSPASIKNKKAGFKKPYMFLIKYILKVQAWIFFI